MKKYIVVFISIIFITVGCYKDKTKFGNKEISEIKFNYEKFDDQYAKDKWETLSLDVTKRVSQTMEKELKYEWEIGGKIVSKEPVLNYVCDTLGDLIGRLRLYNEDGSTFVKFKLKVNSPYETGLIILSKYDNRSMVSFRRTYASDSISKRTKCIVDCLVKENPKIEIGEFGDVGISNSFEQTYIYIATKNPDKCVRLNAMTFKATNYIDARFNDVSRVFSSENGLLFTYGGNKVIEYFAGTDNAFFNGINTSIKELELPNVSINPVALYLFERFSTYSAGTLLFDDKNEQLIKCKSGATIIEEDKFKGLRPHSFSLCDETQNAILMFKDAKGKFKLFHYNAKTDKIDNSVDFSSTAFTDKSVVVAPNSIETNMMFSDGANKIYRFNYEAQNLPTTPFIELPSNYVIKWIDLSYYPANRKLYILAENTTATTGYKSTIFCYKYETKELIWSEDEVGGDPIKFILK